MMNINTTPFEIIENNADFIVVDKPANINFHDEGNIGEGFFNQVKEQLNLSELYPIHRLDKMTSGLIIFAKTKVTAQKFQVLFSQHKIEKFYLALSDKKPKKKQGLIQGDMEKSRRGTWKLARSNTNPAITQFFSYGLEKGLRLFLIKPTTGKTHQIRVALNSLASPIIGDPAYYAESEADRGYLHAFAIRFVFDDLVYSFIQHPKSGEYFTNLICKQKIAEISPPWTLVWPKLK